MNSASLVCAPWRLPPSPCSAGPRYWLMSVAALFSTAGATNAGLYPAAGLCEEMAAMGQFPRYWVAGSAGEHPRDC